MSHTITKPNSRPLSVFDLWLRSCQELNTQIYPLEGNGSTALYKTWSTYEYKHNFYNTSPVYQVWIDGRRVMATENYSAAWNCYEREVKKM